MGLSAQALVQQVWNGDHVLYPIPQAPGLLVLLAQGPHCEQQELCPSWLPVLSHGEGPPWKRVTKAPGREGGGIFCKKTAVVLMGPSASCFRGPHFHGHTWCAATQKVMLVAYTGPVGKSARPGL